MTCLVQRTEKKNETQDDRVYVRDEFGKINYRSKTPGPQLNYEAGRWTIQKNSLIRLGRRDDFLEELPETLNGVFISWRRLF